MSDVNDFVIDRNILRKYTGSESDVVIPEGITYIDKSAFSDCKQQVYVTFPTSMKKIGWSNFERCSKLVGVKMPDSITEINTSAFKNCTALESIELPAKLATIDGHAFYGCGKLKSITIPGKVKEIGSGAFYMCSSLESVIISKGVKIIRSNAFGMCSSLTSVIIPDTVTTIEEGAFSQCPNLREISIPESVIDIGPNALPDCFDNYNADHLCIIGHILYSIDKNAEKVIIPEGIKVIAQRVAGRCLNLSEITVPSTVTSVGTEAFMGCRDLETVHFEKIPEKFGARVFQYCNEKIRFVFPAGALAISAKLPAELANENTEINDEEMAYISLYQSAKAWKDLLQKRKPNDPNAVFIVMLDLYKNDKKVSSEEMASFALRYNGDMKKEHIEELLSLMKERKFKGLQEFENSPEIKDLLAGVKVETNPVEDYVQEYMKNHTLEAETDKTVKVGLPYAETGRLSSREAIAIVITEYMHELYSHLVTPPDSLTAGYVKDGTKIQRRVEADRIGSALDKKALSDFLEALLEKQTYRTYLLAWAAFATDESIARVTATYKSMARGNAKEQYKATNIREVLLINDSQAAMKFFDRIGDLDRYAKMRGTSAMAMRDSVMLPDFGFDADGIKRYDIGGNTIEVSITPDLNFKLYDTNAQKEIRSFPKKSADPKKVEACSKEYGEFKKMVLDFAKNRSELIHKMHISGEYLDQELWHKVYVDHSVIRHLARLLVWEDEAKQTFMVDDGAIIDINGKTYEPQGKIRVAHVLDMSAENVLGWQQVLAKAGKKQLFEQVWEPVINWNREDIPGRYIGTVLSYKERNDLKKALKTHGIDSGSGAMDSDYHPRTGYTFSNEGELIIGTCLSIDYTVDPDLEILTFKRSHLRNGNAAREINAVLLEVDKAAVKSFIAKDNTSALTKELLSNFTAAQITSFVNLAIESKATACTAVLLDYKNEHFSEFAEINEFSLDW